MIFLSLWHMHQPLYRVGKGDYPLPWVFLHAIREYYDFARALLESDAARVRVLGGGQKSPVPAS